MANRRSYSSSSSSIAVCSAGGPARRGTTDSVRDPYEPRSDDDDNASARGGAGGLRSYDDDSSQHVPLDVPYSYSLSSDYSGSDWEAGGGGGGGSERARYRNMRRRATAIADAAPASAAIPDSPGGTSGGGANTGPGGANGGGLDAQIVSPPQSPTPPPPPTVTCAVCLEAHAMDFMQPLSQCGHTYCRECLYGYYHSKITSADFPIVCPLCPTEVTQADLEMVVDYELWQKYEKFAFKAAIGDGFVSCLTPECEFVFFVEEGDAEVRFDCPLCARSYCRACKVAFHDGLTCGAFQAQRVTSAEEAATLAYLRDRQMKQCPKCSRWIELASGCNHVVCTSCKTKFCYNCGHVYPCTCGKDVHVKMLQMRLSLNMTSKEFTNYRNLRKTMRSMAKELSKKDYAKWKKQNPLPKRGTLSKKKRAKIAKMLTDAGLPLEPPKAKGKGKGKGKKGKKGKPKAKGSKKKSTVAKKKAKTTKKKKTTTKRKKVKAKSTDDGWVKVEAGQDGSSSGGSGSSSSSPARGDPRPPVGTSSSSSATSSSSSSASSCSSGSGRRRGRRRRGGRSAKRRVRRR